MHMNKTGAARDCPHCKKKNTVGIDIKFEIEEEDLVKITCECHDCGKLWEDFYTFESANMDAEFTNQQRFEARAKADFRAVAGKVVVLPNGSRVTVVGNTDASPSKTSILIRSPLIVKVRRCSSQQEIEDKILRVVSTDWLTPEWTLEVLEPHPQLKGFRDVVWMNGPRYNLLTGREGRC